MFHRQPILSEPIHVGAPARSDGSKRARALHLLNIGLIVIAAAAISAVNLMNSYDDAFITYRYSYNLATGHGFVYNLNQPIMSTTAPFYGLLLGILGLAGPDYIPLFGGLLSAITLGLTGIALYLYGRLHRAPFCGLLAGLFFVLNPLLPLTFGGEMLFQTAIIAWAFVTYAMNRSVLAALLVGLAMLTRADGAIAAVVLGTHYLIVHRRFPWREAGALVGLLLPFTLLAWVYFGSPLPDTLAAKIAQRDSGFWPRFGIGMLEWIRSFTVQGSSTIFVDRIAAPHAIRFVFFTALGLIALVRYRFWLLPLASVALFVIGYQILGVPFYHWYVVPAVFGLMILAACGVAWPVEIILRAAQRIVPLSRRPLLVSIVHVAAFCALLPGLYGWFAYTQRASASEPDAAEQQYMKAGIWLRQHTPVNASVGYFEIGNVGYYGERTMIDPLALVQPDVVPHLAQRDLTWAYTHYRPDYVIHNPVIFAPFIGKIVDEPWFQQEYHEVAQIPEAGRPTLIIYQRMKTP